MNREVLAVAIGILVVVSFASGWFFNNSKPVCEICLECGECPKTNLTDYPPVCPNSVFIYDDKTNNTLMSIVTFYVSPNRAGSCQLFAINSTHTADGVPQLIATEMVENE